MSVSIRELGIRDQMMLEELLDACKPGWSDGLSPGASGPLAFIADSATFAFGAYVDNEPTGLLWGAHLRCPDGRRETIARELVVLNVPRRDELATSLIEAVVALARRQGSDTLTVADQADSTGAPNYHELGAESTSETGETHYVWNL